MTAAPAEPIAISWSQLRAHQECRQKSALLRAGHRSKGANIRNYFHGMVVDGLMRRWLADPDRRHGQMAAQIDEYIATCAQQAIDDGDGVVRWRHPEDRAELREFCLQLLTRLEPLLDTLVLPYQFACAQRFRQPVVVPYLDGTPTTIYLRGEMDLLTVEAAGRAVWDLKGTKDDSYWRKVLGQLVFYDLAVLAEHGSPTIRVGLIQPMCRNPVLHWTLTDEHRRQMWAAILRMAGDIWRAEASCKTGTDGCRYCEVRHACARYAPVGNTIAIGGNPTSRTAGSTTSTTSTMASALRAAASTAREASA